MDKTPEPAQPSQLPRIVYDKFGNPIDTSKVQAAPAEQPSPQMVYMSRPHDIAQPEISDVIKKKHTESKTLYPYLNLSEGEYVISAVRRHVIGLFQIWGVVLLAIAALGVGIYSVMNMGVLSDSTFVSQESTPAMAMVMLGLIVLLFLGGVLATVVYDGNRFFLTNESVTQHIQTSLFSKKEQTISLTNIEDASFRQKGIVQSLLNYGSIRLSTQGDETTYRFNFVTDPYKQIALLNNAVESFKNGRPVDPSDE